MALFKRAIACSNLEVSLKLSVIAKALSFSSRAENVLVDGMLHLSKMQDKNKIVRYFMVNKYG